MVGQILLFFIFFFGAFICLVFIIAGILNRTRSSGSSFILESGKRRAGRLGENRVSSFIEEVLKEDDIILRNIEIEHDGDICECDNIIINKYGVFVIESKYYKGKLSGNINDYELTKTKITDAGSVFVEYVKNPIRQVDRQCGILHHLLKDNGINEWVEGYVIILGNNQDINERVLHTREEIDRAIHTKSQNNKNQLIYSKQVEIYNILNN